MLREFGYFPAMPEITISSSGVAGWVRENSFGSGTLGGAFGIGGIMINVLSISKKK